MSRAQTASTATLSISRVFPSQAPASTISGRWSGVGSASVTASRTRHVLRSKADGLEPALRALLDRRQWPLAGGDRGRGGSQRPLELGRDPALRGREIAVARAHREAVRLAHGRPGTISIGKARSRAIFRMMTSCW